MEIEFSWFFTINYFFKFIAIKSMVEIFTFTLFVNDPKLFGITYRRYIEKQIRVNLGFEGTPLILLWRGKQQRALNKEVERENIELIQKD